MNSRVHDAIQSSQAIQPTDSPKCMMAAAVITTPMLVASTIVVPMNTASSANSESFQKRKTDQIRPVGATISWKSRAASQNLLGE